MLFIHSAKHEVKMEVTCLYTCGEIVTINEGKGRPQQLNQNNLAFVIRHSPQRHRH